jgi:hypothetical protein
MENFQESMIEYKKQLKKGKIQAAYRGLMEYFNSLKTYFKKYYPDHFVSGSTYYGFMDMTYISFTSEALQIISYFHRYRCLII